MARWRSWLGLLIVVMALSVLAGAARPAQMAAGNTGAVPAGGQTRPAERVAPAPQVNANAVVWRTPAPPAKPQAGDVWVNPKDGAEMVYVPAGDFLMGSAERDKEGYSQEKPQHRMYLDAYWIDKTPVTVAEYRRFCQTTGRSMPSSPEWGWHDDHPVVNVSWDDAVAYATWAEKRLPTEAEWEKAARGTDGREYPWGNQWDSRKSANSAESSSSSTRPVGSHAGGASPYGVLDMVRNVYEWCADWYQRDYYRSAPSRNPQGPDSGQSRVLRGGDWSGVSATPFRCAIRDPFDSGYRYLTLGFRRAREDLCE